MSNLEVEKSEDSVVVRLTVKNTGKRSGAEVIQVYVSDPECSVARPEKELKAFQKVFLRSQETKEFSLTLGKDAFSFFSEEEMKWRLEPGSFVIKVGNASDNILLSKEFVY
jgi:beta-glucosidase